MTLPTPGTIPFVLFVLAVFIVVLIVIPELVRWIRNRQAATKGDVILTPELKERAERAAKGWAQGESDMLNAGTDMFSVLSDILYEDKVLNERTD